MAKSAKQVDDITPKLINGTVGRVIDCFDEIESARGKYMNAARRQRDAIQAAYEAAASKGIPQKVMKLQVKIEQTQSKLVGLITNLEVEYVRMLKRVAKVRGGKAQLALFADLPDTPKLPKTLTEALEGTNGKGDDKDRAEGSVSAGAA